MDRKAADHLPLLLLIAILAIVLHLAIETQKRRTAARHERSMRIATTHASLTDEYRRNARGDAGMPRIAA